MHPNQFPKEFGWEELRIKRFLIEGSKSKNHFGVENYHGLENHVDVYSHAHAKRILCLMVYLNDDFEEGETHFSLFGTSVKPKQGRLLIFPTMWTYLHNRRRPLPTSNNMATGAKDPNEPVDISTSSWPSKKVTSQKWT